MDENLLEELLNEAVLESEDLRDQLSRVETFRTAGVMTNNRGLVLRMEDGTEFQVTVVQSR